MKGCLFHLLALLVITEYVIAAETNVLFIAGSQAGNLTLLSYDLSSGNLQKQTTFSAPLLSTGSVCFGASGNGTFFSVHESSISQVDARNFQLRKIQPLTPSIDSVSALSFDAKSNNLIGMVHETDDQNVTLVSIDSTGNTNSIADTGFTSTMKGLLSLDMSNKISYYSTNGLLVGQSYKTGKQVSTAKYSMEAVSLDFFSGKLISVSEGKSGGPFQLVATDPVTGNATVLLKFPDDLIANETTCNPQLSFVDRNRGIHYAFLIQSDTLTPLMATTNLNPFSGPILQPLSNFPKDFTPMSVGVLQVRRSHTVSVLL